MPTQRRIDSFLGVQATGLALCPWVVAKMSLIRASIEAGASY
jgi:hypothetical protein